MNYSIQKLFDDFLKKVGPDEVKMLDTVSPDAAFNYVFFLYKKFYADYPTGEIYKALEQRFASREAA